jgi:hypothetical protein
MSIPEMWEFLANVVTTLGLPFAIVVFWREQRKARENEAQQSWALLTDNYTRFLELMLENPDLKMGADEPTPNLSEEQKERTMAMFAILVALFERSYINLHETNMKGRQLRRWRSWEDYMREWCRRADFRAALPYLLGGGDPEFVAYLGHIAREEAAVSGTR